MLHTRREAARVDAFVAVIRASAHPNRRPVAVDDTIALPRIIATSTPLGAERDEPVLVDRLPWLAIVAVFVALFAPLVILLGIDAAPAAPHAPATLDTHERVIELGAGRVTR